MNRVWRRFLSKVSWVVGLIVYLLAAMALPSYAFYAIGWDPNIGMGVGSLVFILLPMVAFGLREAYKDAKREVEIENRRLMSSLKGERY